MYTRKLQNECEYFIGEKKFVKASIFCQTSRASKIPRGFLARAFQNFGDKKASKTANFEIEKSEEKKQNHPNRVSEYPTNFYGEKKNVRDFLKEIKFDFFSNFSRIQWLRSPGDKTFSRFLKGELPPLKRKVQYTFPTPIKWKEYQLEPLGAAFAASFGRIKYVGISKKYKQVS